MIKKKVKYGNLPLLRGKRILKADYIKDTYKSDEGRSLDVGTNPSIQPFNQSRIGKKDDKLNGNQSLNLQLSRPVIIQKEVRKERPMDVRRSIVTQKTREVFKQKCQEIQDVFKPEQRESGDEDMNKTEAIVANEKQRIYDQEDSTFLNMQQYRQLALQTNTVKEQLSTTDREFLMTQERNIPVNIPYIIDVQAQNLLDVDWLAHHEKMRPVREVQQSQQQICPTKLQKQKNQINSLTFTPTNLYADENEGLTSQQHNLLKRKKRYGW